MPPLKPQTPRDDVLGRRPNPYECAAAQADGDARNEQRSQHETEDEWLHFIVQTPYHHAILAQMSQRGDIMLQYGFPPKGNGKGKHGATYQGKGKDGDNEENVVNVWEPIMCRVRVRNHRGSSETGMPAMTFLELFGETRQSVNGGWVPRAI